MNINVTISGSTAVLNMNGRFDFSAHRDFKNAYTSLMQQAGVNNLEVDLSNVEYVDSSALGMLLMLRERAQAVNKSVVLSKPSHAVAQILDIASMAWRSE